MARKIRIEYAGAAYHVMARRNQGRDIYADDRDRKLWLATLDEACEKTGWRIHWPAEAERAAEIGAAEKATEAGL
jgi:putative transposase